MIKQSVQEEILSCLYFIAGCMAHNREWTILGWLLIAMAAIDTITAVWFAYGEAKEERALRKLEDHDAP